MNAPTGWLLLLPFLVPGCAAPQSEVSFSSPTATGRHEAIRAADPRDPKSLKGLVEQLESDDAAVRLHAIAALRRATSESLGYRYDDPPDRRAAAVMRWVQWCAEAETAAGARDEPDG